MSGESSSRTNLEMPDVQRALLQELLKTGKPVVLVLFTGRPLVLTWEEEHVPAILNVWFGGSEAAYAISDVLFGDVNPSGKLTATFPQNVGQIPLFYNHKNTGRPLQEGRWFEKFRSNYLDVSNEPLYPFGYGLSYTTFAYSDIHLSSTEMSADGELTATVTVTNTGSRDGEEVVQVYLKKNGETDGPIKTLRAFKRVRIPAGKTVKVELELTPKQLEWWDNTTNTMRTMQNTFDVLVGGSSQEKDLQKKTLKLL